MSVLHKEGQWQVLGTWGTTSGCALTEASPLRATSPKVTPSLGTPIPPSTGQGGTEAWPPGSVWDSRDVGHFSPKAPGFITCITAWLLLRVNPVSFLPSTAVAA